MIYRPPERAGSVRRGASNRDVALLLVAMAFLTALLFSYAGVPGQPRFDTAATSDAALAIDTPLPPSGGRPGQGGGPSTPTEAPSLATQPAAPSFGGPMPGFEAPTDAFVVPTSPFSPPPSFFASPTSPPLPTLERPTFPTPAAAFPIETVASKPTLTAYPGP